KNQKVDIGDHVTRGHVLAEIDAPLLLKEEEQAAIALEGAKSQLQFSEALLLAAEADVKTAKTIVEQRKAEMTRATAALEFRQKQYDRYKELAGRGTVDARALDEQYGQLEAARGARELAQVAVATAESEV